MKKQQNDTSKELHLIGVAEVHYWHGFDRLVRGLADYYRNNPEYKVYFHIVGPLSGERNGRGSCLLSVTTISNRMFFCMVLCMATNWMRCSKKQILPLAAWDATAAELRISKR